MNQLLLDRSTGNLKPQAFARNQTSHFVRAIQPAPRLLFDGGEKEHGSNTQSGGRGDSQDSAAEETKIWAHQAGVNALAIDVENRMSAAPLSSIKIGLLTTTTASSQAAPTQPSKSGTSTIALQTQTLRSNPPVSCHAPPLHTNSASPTLASTPSTRLPSSLPPTTTTSNSTPPKPSLCPLHST